MRNAKKYRIITLLAMALALLLLGIALREPSRMATAEYRQQEEYVLKGAAVYAESCVQCHGPRGEGSVGMPLNRTDLRVDPDSPAGQEVYQLLSEAIARGRDGSADRYQWEKVQTPEGKDAWLSYTAMPAWSTEYGGPLDEDAIKALTRFIMKDDPDGTQWSLIGSAGVAEIPPAGLTPDGSGEIPLPDADVDPATNAAAKALLRNVGQSQCLTCHAIGSRGGKVGPDLTNLGNWGVDQAFLESWIKNASGPNAVPHEERMPIYWSINRATRGPRPDLSIPTLSEGPYYMPPAMTEMLTDQQIAILSKYLLGLK